MKKLLSLLLALILGISVFVSCAKDSGSGSGDDSQTDPSGSNGGQDPSDSQHDTDTDVPMISFFGEETVFYIVYPDECTDELRSKAEALKTTMENIFPEMTFFATNANKDWGDSFWEKNEILIGDTGRTESVEVISSLKEKEFAVKLADSGKLVIAGAEEGLTVEAINYFSFTYVMPAYETNKLMLEEGLYYTDVNHNIARLGWHLTSIPSYQGGVLAENAYSGGTDASMMASGGKLQAIRETNLDEFNDYLDDLKAAGYTEIFRHTIANNVYVQYVKNAKLIYAYFVPTENEAKVVHETIGTTPVNQFSYSYTPKAGDTSTFYQYALMHNPKGQGGHNDTTLLWENCGLFDIIKLADNSVVLLDGGWEPQATDKAVDECMKFLREITGTPEGKKVRIAAIYLTHRHDDHMAFAAKLVDQHKDEIEVERLMHNLLPSATNGAFDNFGKTLAKNFPKAKFIQLHTGQKIQLANATFEVLFTQEDLYSRTDLPSKDGVYDDNNSSTMLKMTMNGRTFLLPGDWSGGHVNRDRYEYKGMEASLLKAMELDNGTSYLKCDVLQIPHHAINDWIDNFIKAVDADVAFIPQQDVEKKNFAHPCYTNIVNSLNKFGIDNKNIFFAGRYTYGITVALDGTMTLSYRDIAGYDDEYKTMVLDKFAPFHAPSSGVVPFK